MSHVRYSVLRVRPWRVMGSENATAGVTPLDSETVEYLRNSPQFQTLEATLQANPLLLQPLLYELGRQNPRTVTDFMQLVMNEPRGESNLVGYLEDGSISQSVQVTPEEAEAIARLEGMGFEQTLVLQVFIACDRNEELAANQLLDLNPEFFEG